MFNQGIGNLQRERGLMPTDSQIIRELGGGRTSQDANQFMPSAALLKQAVNTIERMRRRGASLKEQLKYLDFLITNKYPEIAKSLWDMFFIQNIGENSERRGLL